MVVEEFPRRNPTSRPLHNLIVVYFGVASNAPLLVVVRVVALSRSPSPPLDFSFTVAVAITVAVVVFIVVVVVVVFIASSNFRGTAAGDSGGGSQH